MTNKEFYREFGNIDPQMVEKAAPTGKGRIKKKNTWVKWVSLAACFCLIVGAVFASGVLNFESVHPDDEPDGGNGKEVLPFEYLLGSAEFEGIVFGDNVNFNPDNENVDSVIPGDGDNNSLLYDDSWIEWNGIKIGKSLYGGLATHKPNTLIAITAYSLSSDKTALTNYEYKGKTYSAIRDEFEAANDILFILQQTKDFSDYYDENYDKWIKENPDEFWEKVYSNVDKEFLHDNNYIIGGDDPFNVDAISNDMSRYETLCNQLENALRLCEIEYRAKHTPKIDWNKLAGKGFDVYNNQGTYIVVLSVGNMDLFADCIKEICTAEIVSDTVFRYATYSELGLPSHDLPCDDGEKIVPGGVVDIPIDEGPFEDDVALED